MTRQRIPSVEFPLMNIPRASSLHVALVQEKPENKSRSQMAMEKEKRERDEGNPDRWPKCVSQTEFDQNSFLIVRGCVSVPFNAIPLPFLVQEKPCVMSFLIFACAAGRPPNLAEKARIPFWVGGRFGGAAAFPTWVAATFSIEGRGKLLALKGAREPGTE